LARPAAGIPLQKAAAIVSRFTPGKRERPKASVYSIRIDSLEWLPLAGECDATLVIILLDRDSLPHFFNAFASLAQKTKNRIAISFPPFIGETETQSWEEAGKKLIAAGVRQFFVQSPGMIPQAGENIRLFALPAPGTLNIPARLLLNDLGVNAFVYSPEDDFLNIRNTRAFPGIMTLYSHTPLFISRIGVALPERARLSDRNGNAFFTTTRAGLTCLVANAPLCLFAKRDKLEELGIRHFLLDFSFIPPNKKQFTAVLTAYREKKRLLPSTLFNFKRELA
jgi:hypothetical protein